jgi:hypothetical protein
MYKFQFFTSAPLSLGTEPATPKSVYPDTHSRKRGRKHSDEPEEHWPLQPGRVKLGIPREVLLKGEAQYS